MNTPDRKKGSGRRLHDATLAWLGERLGPGALPFAAAVTLHLARAGAGKEPEVARRVAGVLADPAEAGAAARLAADPALLASFFQNADLLHRHAFAGADAVALLVMEAVALLEPSDRKDPRATARDP